MIRILSIRSTPGSLVFHASGPDKFVTAGLLLAAFLLGFGITLPIMETRELFLFTNRISIVNAVSGLWQDNEIFLCIFVAIFSLIFPALKLGATDYLWRKVSIGSPSYHRVLSYLEQLGKWSLAEVLIIALLIVIVKSSGFASATVGIGLYPFTASIALTALIVSRLKLLARREALTS